MTVVLVRFRRWYPLVLLSLCLATVYWGWRVEVVLLVVAGYFVLGVRERWAPEFLAGLLAASAYWYGGWPWGVVGLLAAAFLAWGMRRWQAEPSLAPAENRRG